MLKIVVAPFNTRRLTPSKLELVIYLFPNQRFSFFKNYDFSPFLSKMSKNLISQGAVKTDFGERNRPIYAPNVLKYACCMGL